MSLLDLTDEAVKDGFDGRLLVTERVMNFVTADAANDRKWRSVLNHASAAINARGDDDRATVILHTEGMPGQLLMLVEPAERGSLMVKVMRADEAVGY